MPKWHRAATSSTGLSLSLFLSFSFSFSFFCYPFLSLFILTFFISPILFNKVAMNPELKSIIRFFEHDRP